MIVGIFDLNSLLFRYCLENKYGGYQQVISKIQSIVIFYNLNQIYLVVDSSKNWRKEAFNLYKANRVKDSEKMKEFFENINQLYFLLNQHNIKVISKIGYEADDVISTLTKKLSLFKKVLIITSDKDLLQIPNCDFLILKQREIFLRSKDYQKIKRFIGVYPYQIVDYLSLCGDASDNIPGVANIGKIRAKKLLEEYDNIENIFFNLNNLNKKLQNNLIQCRFDLFLFKNLIKLESNIKINIKEYIINRVKIMKL